MWNSNTPVISIKLLYNPSQFLDQGFMLCFDQIRPSANINGEVSLLFDYLQFLLARVEGKLALRNQFENIALICTLLLNNNY